MTSIIAIGGAQFASDERSLALDRYIISQVDKPHPKVLFIPTASGDSDTYVCKFYSVYSGLGAKPQHLSLFGRTAPLEDVIYDQDVIYVGGGNTKSMLSVWSAWGLPEMLGGALRAGILLAGVSSGAACWFDECLTDAWAQQLTTLKCLGLLAGSCCPHYDVGEARRREYHRVIVDGHLKSGYGIDDGVALHFTDGKAVRCVSSRQTAAAYYVSMDDNGLMSSKIATERI